jgi:FemAB-related protein (PEP-CTERM system-associated)
MPPINPNASAAPAAAPLRITQLDLADPAACKRWDDFVTACPGATFFHLAGWGKAIRRVFGHPVMYLQAERGGVVEGVLPLAQVRSRLFGNALVSLPFAAYAGVAALSDAAGAELETAAQALARNLHVDHLELRHISARHPDWPTQDLYCTFRKRIDSDPEANLLAIPRKQRAMVRKGIKHGLSSDVDADAARFFALYSDNVRRHGTPALPRRWFDALMQQFGPQCEVLTVSSADGRVLSSVLTFYFRDEVLPYYAGDDEAARELAANDFKYWELMRRAAVRGSSVFDYGRSKRGTGTFAFKTHWGFEPTPLHYEYRLYRRDAIPQNNPMNPKYRVLIALWRRLPLPVANAIGPHLSKSLG